MAIVFALRCIEDNGRNRLTLPSPWPDGAHLCPAATLINLSRFFQGNLSGRRLGTPQDRRHSTWVKEDRYPVLLLRRARGGRTGARPRARDFPASRRAKG